MVSCEIHYIRAIKIHPFVNFVIYLSLIRKFSSKSIDMKSSLVLSLFLLCQTAAFSQVRFERGYIIDNEGQRRECLIRNWDWKFNPEEFVYKFSPEGESLTGNLTSVKEFGVPGEFKFVSMLVQIDITPDDISTVSIDRNPSFTKKIIFLKELISGKASLYHYETEKFQRFFYTVNDSAIQQLIYKKYKLRTGDGYQMATNTAFKQQLFNEVNCGNIKAESLKFLNYNKSDLTKYFIQYNKCADPQFVTTRAVKKSIFNLKVTPGLSFTTLKISNFANGYSEVNFGSQISPRLGAEAEFILPYNRNKWGIVLEPAYQYFKAEKQVNTRTASIDYSSIEFLAGVQHYFFIGESTRIFLHGAVVIDAAIISNNIKSQFNSEIKAAPSRNFSLGAGWCFKKSSIEMRYYTNRNLLNNYIAWSSDFTRVSVIFAYKHL